MATIVMTGGSSGFGRLAAAGRLRGPDHRLILGSRGAGDGVPLDLASLGSVRSFAAAVHDQLAGVGIDALVLNAGMIRPDADGRTIDGYETTFAVNHLAHFLLIRLLLPELADGARVVLTTSGTHDPATGAGLATPRHADADLLAHPDRDPQLHHRPRTAGEHAYTASKLCGVLTVRAFNRQPESRSRGIRAIAYDPGQVFGTGLARGLPLPLRMAWQLLGSPVGAPLRRLTPTLSTREAAGEALADLALGAVEPPPDKTYAALRRGVLTWPDPSEPARRDDLAQALWRDSVRLTGPVEP